MQTAASVELPDPFDRVRLWTVRRQEPQGDAFGVGRPPGSVQPGVVVRGIVQNQHHSPPSRSIGPAELAEEIKEGLGSESLRLAQVKRPPVSQAHGAKVAVAPPCGVVQQNRIAVLRRHPHATARAILLEVHLIQRPKVSTFVGGQPAQLSLWRLVGLGSRVQSAGEVSGVGTRTGGADAGTAALPASRRTPVPPAPTAVCHPPDGPPGRGAAAEATKRSSPVSVADGPIGSAALIAPLPEDLPVRGLRNGAPNTLPCAVSRPTSGPPEGWSLLAPPAARHEVDDRNGIPRSGGSRPAVRARHLRSRQSSELSCLHESTERAPIHFMRNSL